MMSKNQKKPSTQIGRKSERLNQVIRNSSSFRTRPNLNFHHMKTEKRNDIFKLVEDVYEKAQNAKDMLRGKTGLVYDRRMVNHKCLWYPAHIECPERFVRVIERCEQLGLVERCEPVSAREATREELLTVHSKAHIDQLLSTHQCLDQDRMELLASKYDAIYIHPETYQLALLAAGSTIQLVNEVCAGSVQNGMAIIRPPGHHAMHEEFNGFCFLNNVAVAARHALDKLKVQKVLIVDWDVHHGQATQQMFYNDPRVVYFSIHRYEHGEFWPNLRESNFDYIGDGKGTGYNFNIPLNTTGLGDSDYMAVFHHVLLPMASEWQPEITIVSAGYDAAIGCPEGEMEVTPACYAHLVSSLMALGKVAVILEGGYCLRSLAEGCALTLRALLGDASPSLPPLTHPSESIQETILNCIYSHRQFWRCFQSHGYSNYLNQYNPRILYNYNGPKPESYPTRDCCVVQTQDVIDHFNKKLDLLVGETTLLTPQHPVCFVYDPIMMEHTNLNDPDHPEKPSRIQRIFERHLEYKLLERLHILQSRYASRDELLLVHDDAYLKELEQLCALTEQMTDDIKQKQLELEKRDSVYIHRQSYKCASLAAGSLLQVVDSVMRGESKAGVAVVRPPGHHAEADKACGFCIFNNISVAAKYALKAYGLKRILILDWDVHHGNGTQRIFLSDPQVLYISIHRYDRGMFFPNSEDAAATVVGSGAGRGFNVNIPWNQKGMGNAEYVTAFLQVVMPIAYQFGPELVLVSAGFDAAIGDPLGGCKVSLETYALLTSWLAPLAMGRVILSLEGGYNLSSVSYGMTLCTKALLGDPTPPVDLQPMKAAAVADLRAVLRVQATYWSALCFIKGQRINTDELSDKLAHLEIQSDREIKVENNSCGDASDYPVPFSPHETELSDRTQEPTGTGGQQPSSSVPGDNMQPGASQGTSAGGPTQKLQITTTIDSILKELGMDEGFPVHPRHDCPHLPAVTPVPASGIDIASPCLECIPDSCAFIENWICLTCYTVHCGRVIKEHMLHHSIELPHPIVLGFLDLSVWCYSCDSYIESPVLYEAKNAAYISKFAQTMPNIYQST